MRIVCLCVGLLCCAGGIQARPGSARPFPQVPVRFDEVAVWDDSRGYDNGLRSELADVVTGRVGASLDEAWLADDATLDARIFAALFQKTGCASKVIPVRGMGQGRPEAPGLSLDVRHDSGELAGVFLLLQLPLLPAWFAGFPALLQTRGEVRVSVVLPGTRTEKVTTRARLTYWTILYRRLDRSLASELASAMALRDAAEQVAARLCEGAPLISGSPEPVGGR